MMNIVDSLTDKAAECERGYEAIVNHQFAILPAGLPAVAWQAGVGSPPSKMAGKQAGMYTDHTR